MYLINDCKKQYWYFCCLICAAIFELLITKRHLVSCLCIKFCDVGVRQRKEGNVLFNDALNTFYLQLYGVGHMVKDHSDSERGNLLCHIGYSFRLTARVLLYAPFHRQDSTYHSLCYNTPHEGSIRRPIAP